MGEKWEMPFMCNSVLGFENMSILKDKHNLTNYLTLEHIHLTLQFKIVKTSLKQRIVCQCVFQLAS